MVRTVEQDPDRIGAALRERRSLLERSAETYLALADRVDDEIGALERAQRLAVQVEGIDFEEASKP